MGTRGNIGLSSKDKRKIEYVYNNWDGYPRGVGKILIESYNTEDKIKELFSYGSISSLGSKIGTKHDFDDRPKDTCNFYHRDRGEKLEKGKKINYTEEELKKIMDYMDYTYIFEENNWYVLLKNCEYDKDFNITKMEMRKELLTKEFIESY